MMSVLLPPPPPPPLLLPLAQAARPSAPAATTATATIGFAMSTSSASDEPPRTGRLGADLGELITGSAPVSSLEGHSRAQLDNDSDTKLCYPWGGTVILRISDACSMHVSPVRASRSWPTVRPPRTRAA